MPTSSKRVSRLHSKDSADAAWRAQQAQVDADIEGLSRDAEADRLVAQMTAAGIAPRQRIEPPASSDYRSLRDRRFARCEPPPARKALNHNDGVRYFLIMHQGKVTVLARGPLRAEP